MFRPPRPMTTPSSNSQSGFAVVGGSTRSSNAPMIDDGAFKNEYGSPFAARSSIICSAHWRSSSPLRPSGPTFWSIVRSITCLR